MKDHKDLLLDLIAVRDYTVRREIQTYRRLNREVDIPKEKIEQLEELQELKIKVQKLI